MSTQVGRISGPLLKSNLLRNGVDLSFETDLLYLDTNNHKIGINTSSPVRDLQINGTFNSTALIIDNSITVGNVFLPQGGVITTITGGLNFSAASNIYTDKLISGRLKLDNNIIHNDTVNEDIELRPNGTGKVSLTKSLLVNANLHATGDVTFDNNVIIGDNASQDTVTFNAKINNSLIPSTDNTYSVGSNTHLWKNIYVNELSNLSSLNIQQDLIFNGSNYTVIQGKIWYVAKNGSPSNQGNHPNAPFDSIQLALSNALAGDTIFVYPGTYYETFPLTIPEGVSIKGISIRECIINPSPSTTTKDAFLLNSDTNISDLTIQNFYFDAVNNTGYAFKFASGFNFNSKSPRIDNVTIITSGSITSGSDPRGFDSGDAGKGAYLDGSVASSNSSKVNLKMNKVNFITPGVDSITALNGVILDFENIFIYFSNKGYYITEGLGRDRQATLSIPNNNLLASNAGDGIFYCTQRSWEQSGFKVGSVLTNAIYFSPGTTVTNVQGPQINYGTTYYTISISNNIVANLPAATNFSVLGKIYNSIIRSTNSTTSYGIYSAYADGESSFIILNNHTFYYVGSGKDISNDHSLNTINNGIYQTNDGTIQFVGQTQDGNFGIGDQFSIDTFNNQLNLNWTSNSTINTLVIVDQYSGSIFSTINKSQITTGNLIFTGNLIETTTGNLNFSAASNKTYLQQNVTATNVNISNDFKVKGNITFGNAPTDNVIITPNLDQDIVPDINNTYNLGSSSKKWLNLWGKDLHISNIDITSSTVSSSLTNSDLNLVKNGTGTINIENISFDTNLRSTDNIILSTGSTSLKINSNTALMIPVNVSSSIANPINTGELIYESDTKFYTGASTHRLTLGGVYSLNRNDYIQLDTLNQLINFKNSQSTIFSLSSSVATTQALQIGNIHLENNAFTSVNNDFSIKGNGTGSVSFNNTITFNDDTINNLTNLPLIISHTGTGYLKFNNTKGLAIPEGDTASRMSSPEVGTTRFNTDLDYVEVWNGTEWTVSSGTFTTAQDINELSDIWTLILG